MYASKLAMISRASGGGRTIDFRHLQLPKLDCLCFKGTSKKRGVIEMIFV